MLCVSSWFWCLVVGCVGDLAPQMFCGGPHLGSAELNRGAMLS